MNNSNQNPFTNIYLVDFEYQQPEGENPTPVCMVVLELNTGKITRIWRDELLRLSECPLDTGPNSLWVCYYAIAEVSCFLSLAWSVPIHLLDLYPEFLCLTNGTDIPCGKGLLGALAYFGHPCTESAHKDAMRKLIMTKSEWSADERTAILDYCESDVRALLPLMQSMLPRIDLPQALFRGDFMKVAAKMERRGIPIDVELLDSLEKNAPSIKDRLIDHVNKEFPLFSDGIFKKDKLENFVQASGIFWPRHSSGTLCCDDETFKAMAQTHGGLLSLVRETRSVLSKMRKSSLAIGRDGRNRCGLSPFQSITGRNQPSNSKFIFGQPNFKRRAIKAPPGKALAYIDWSQQEFGIAAALSGDSNMMAAYRTGDPYLEFGKQAGVIPSWGTKESHKAERDNFKSCALAVLYGMGAQGLADKINQPKHVAERLLRLHREIYAQFWSWSDAVVDYAMSVGEVSTVLGWKLKIANRLKKEINTRSIRNFPMQANAAEIMRLAAILGDRCGIQICAPIHDAFLIESDEALITSHASIMQDVMVIASREVLDGFELRSDVEIIRSGESYDDPRGRIIWDRIDDLVNSNPATMMMRPEAPPQSFVSNQGGG